MVAQTNDAARRLGRSHGFTLVELVVVMVIGAILVAVAVPAYMQTVYASRRSDATVALRNLQLAEEKFRANNTTYGSIASLGVTSATNAGYYSLSISSNTATGYTLTATAVNGLSQAKDTGCTTLTLTQSGTTITNTPSTCWGQ